MRDEAAAFAKRLADFAAVVEHACYTDMIHPFVSFAAGIPAGMTALEQMGSKLRRVFSAYNRINGCQDL